MLTDLIVFFTELALSVMSNTSSNSSLIAYYEVYVHSSLCLLLLKYYVFSSIQANSYTDIAMLGTCDAI